MRIATTGARRLKIAAPLAKPLPVGGFRMGGGGTSFMRE
jgi:hypothetical protein